MLAPSLPTDERERIKALRELKILETPIQEAFERITRLAKQLYNVPIASISLVDEQRQWFKSIQGINPTETSREVSFCGHTILQDDVFLVPDAKEDDRFVDNPLVIGDPNIRFYAGYPVRAKNGKKVGTICLIDQTPRQFSKDELKSLADLAALVESELRQHSLSHAQKLLINELDQALLTTMVDPLTRLWNRGGMERILEYQLKENQEIPSVFGLALLDVDHFKKVNDQYGHLIGDEALRTLAKCLVKSCRSQDAVGRWGGEEFMLIILANDEAEILKITERILSQIESEPIKLNNDQSFHITATIGVAVFTKNNVNQKKLIETADQALYEGKNKGRNRVILKKC